MKHLKPLLQVLLTDNQLFSVFLWCFVVADYQCVS